MGQKIGIRDVAHEAGVSITTVSHALNGKGRINPDTRRRVQEVAERLGYRPNLVARNLAGGRTGLIGMAIAQTRQKRFAVSDFAYYAQLMSAATVAAFDRGYGLVLASGIETAWSKLLLDGAIVVDPLLDDPLCAELRRRHVSLVSTGRVPGGREGFWVDNDHVGGTRAMLDHLAARGAERIALLASPPITSYAIDARDSYEGWCVERGLRPRVAIARADLTEGSGFEATIRLLRDPAPPDAVYATLDRLALGALLAAQAEGMAVPSQLLIAGCTDSDAGRSARPSLTALALNPEQIGREAVAMVASLIEGEHPPEAHVFVPSKILARGSTRRSVEPTRQPRTGEQPSTRQARRRAPAQSPRSAQPSLSAAATPRRR
ncbi:MAG: LacI family DNA-binding transcriptional regulator [Solirubrobacteraceae bacterium]